MMLNLFFSVVLAVIPAVHFDDNRIVASFGVVSDVHIDAPVSAPAQKFQNALLQLEAKAAEKDRDGLDGILVAGDLINSAYANEKNYVQINYFKDVYESVLNPVNVPLVYAPGNHDVFREWTMDDIAQAQNLSQRLGSDYFKYDLDMESKNAMECRHCVVKGVHILTVFPVSRNPVTYLPEQKAWLDRQLQDITSVSPSAYVLILTHPMITGTVYGSLLGDYWATADLTPILEKYPQAVIFGGHLHFPLNDPRSIWQGSFTAVGCASVRYMAIENGKYENMRSATVMRDADEFSQGLLIQLDARGNMRMTRMDFYHNCTIGEPWTISTPSPDGKNLKTYSSDVRITRNTAPVLGDLRLIKGEQTDDGFPVIATFPSGKDDEFVHHYVIDVCSADTLVCRKKILADFYKVESPAKMRKGWMQDLGILKPGKYTVSLVAYDSWDVESNSVVRTLDIPAL